MSLSRSINVGIVGLGWPGERHAEALHGSSLGNVYAACDLNAERLKAFAEAFGPKQIFTSYDKMLLDADLDAVVIGLPNALHYPFSQKALQAGKHVYLEKPLAHTIEEGFDIAVRIGDLPSSSFARRRTTLRGGCIDRRFSPIATVAFRYFDEMYAVIFP